MMTADEYRTHAERCVRLAKDAVTQELRDEMFALAKRWALLAEASEQERATPAKRSVEPFHPSPHWR
jgi:hypothetical protein